MEVASAPDMVLRVAHSERGWRRLLSALWGESSVARWKGVGSGNGLEGRARSLECRACRL